KEIFENQKSWPSLVPEGTKELLESIKGDQRLARIVLSHPRPVVTADLLIPVDDWSHLALIKRKHWPFEGHWANSGGHREPYERLKLAAIREGAEEAIDPQIFILKHTKVHKLKV